ncbi:MAG: type II secretion system F family protein [Patescibacteria group bacterium]
MKFKYVAKQKGGSTITDFIIASTKTEARKKLTDMNMSLISLQEQTKQPTVITNLNFSIGWVKGLDVALFVKNLSVMIRAGLPVNEALEITAAQATGKFRRILNKILTYVQEGKALADSLRYFPHQFKDFYIDVIKVGETAGNLEENLQHLSIQIEKEIMLKRKIKAALIYPIFVLLSTLSLGVVLSVFVLPRLSRLFASLKTELPASTRALLWFSNLMQNDGIYVIIGLAVIIISLYLLVHVKFIKPIWHFMILETPLVGRIAKIYNVARFNRNLYVLLKSGLTINESAETIINIVDNEVYKKALRDVLKEVEKGKSINSALTKHSNLFPAMVTRMINVGEKSGRLEEILLYLADFYEEEVDNVTKNISSIIEPLLLICIGLIIGFVGLSIITPIYKITGSVSPNH